MAEVLPDTLDRVDPARAWEPAPADVWNRKWAGHLYRRAAFGATPDELRTAEKDGLAKTLDRLLAGEPTAAARARMLDDTGERSAGDDTDALRTWWLYAVLHSGHPLREKLALFWHNHFATSVAKVNQPKLMFRQNQLLRKHALGKFGPFLRDMARDPAMLAWLDSNENVKAHPNENFAREVMELFSLGVGNYTEKDIREAARAFTGWHTDVTGEDFQFNAALHDDGPKTILAERGNWTGNDVLGILLDRPACATFLARKLYRYFVSETDPPAKLIAPLAARYRNSGYDTAALVRTMLGSRLFFSPHAYRQRIKSPVELAVGAVRASWPGPIPPAELVPALDGMGQALFAPPNVKGWPGGRQWLNHATLLARHNFAERVASGTVNPQGGRTDMRGATFAPVATPPKAPAPPPDAPEPPPAHDAVTFVRQTKAASPKEIVARLADHLLDGELTDAQRAKLEAFVADGKPADKALNRRIREAAHVIMCLPEYQLA